MKGPNHARLQAAGTNDADRRVPTVKPSEDLGGCLAVNFNGGPGRYLQRLGPSGLSIRGPAVPGALRAKLIHFVRREQVHAPVADRWAQLALSLETPNAGDTQIQGLRNLTTREGCRHAFEHADLARARLAGGAAFA
jgi:hypothetical protein